MYSQLSTVRNLPGSTSARSGDRGDESARAAGDSSLTADELAELREIFSLLDKDRGGSISKDELADLMHTLGIRASPDDVASMLREVDTDGSGEIDFHEFAAVMSKRVDVTFSQAEVKGAFRVFQSVGDPPGKIKAEALVQALLSFGPAAQALEAAAAAAKAAEQSYVRRPGKGKKKHAVAASGAVASRVAAATGGFSAGAGGAGGAAAGGASSPLPEEDGASSPRGESDSGSPNPAAGAASLAAGEGEAASPAPAAAAGAAPAAPPAAAGGGGGDKPASGPGSGKGRGTQFAMPLERARELVAQMGVDKHGYVDFNAFVTMMMDGC